MARRSRNMSPNRIKYMLSIKGYCFLDIDRQFGLAYNTAGKATRYPHMEAEKAIAHVLGKRPENIWPTRYSKDGTRLKPQPSHNYKEFCALRKDQKTVAA
ncbi:MAG: helix-turn-helix domain-containing protein [Emcibacter sp.]|nr:helix-turn-helix domain-containing protein [Emcibacter sp.]